MDNSTIPDCKLEASDLESTNKYDRYKDCELKCLICEEQFKFFEANGKDNYLAHLFCSHRLVIADVDEIADLQEYLLYWIDKFKGNLLEEYCTTMLLDQLPDGTVSKNEKYYLLSDILSQDYELRKKLHQRRLERALAKHQFERTDREFSKECLYCRDVIRGLRSDFLEHLFTKHYLQLGKPENLVYVDELLEKVQLNLENLICLYCEKIFKDRVTLKEHMRKKGHKRINPNNRAYDKFFLVNYRNEKSKHTKSIEQSRRRNNARHRKERSEPKEMDALNRAVQSSGDSDSDWCEWDVENLPIECLFCPQTDNDFSLFKNHMLQEHGLNFDAQIIGLNFYQKVKAVNYTRRQMHMLRCVSCNIRLNDLNELLEHMASEKHFGLGSRSQWDKPEFFFSTFEDDGLLCVLDDGNENENDESTVRIIPEETIAKINKDAERLSLENSALP